MIETCDYEVPGPVLAEILLEASERLRLGQGDEISGAVLRVIGSLGLCLENTHFADIAKRRLDALRLALTAFDLSDWVDQKRDNAWLIDRALLFAAGKAPIRRTGDESWHFSADDLVRLAEEYRSCRCRL